MESIRSNLATDFVVSALGEALYGSLSEGERVTQITESTTATALTVEVSSNTKKRYFTVTLNVEEEPF